MLRVSGGRKLAEGEMRVLDIDGTKVSVAAAGGGLYAFDDACTHMGCSLGEGKLEGTTVTCPCHGSQFDVTSGAVIRPHLPTLSGRRRSSRSRISSVSPLRASVFISSSRAAGILRRPRRPQAPARSWPRQARASP